MDSYLQSEPYLNRKRVLNEDYPYFVTCPICKGIAWLPKSCKSCQTHYCSSCIKNRQLGSTEPIRCPTDDCSEFVEGRALIPVLHMLSTLRLTCRYRVYGCEEVLPYDHLETHEEICDYQQKTCTGCHREFAKKDFNEHESACPLYVLTCRECNTNYQRQQESEHTETKCLRQQLIDLRKRFNALEREIQNSMGRIGELHNSSNLSIPVISEDM